MVGIIFIGDLKYCPYLKRYEKILQELNEPYEFLFWNRSGDYSEQLPENYIPFKKPSVLLQNKFTKAKDYYCYRRWLKKKIKERKYRMLILLSTLSGILITDVVLTRYQKNYIFDIRDYSYEHNALFYKVEKNLLKKSRLNVISSEGFRKFLPKEEEYVIVNNITLPDKLEHKFSKKEYGSTLNLVWNGALRFFDQQKHIIEKLSNDSRFQLLYYGAGAEMELYRSYLEKNPADNVELKGVYKSSETEKILKNADIINNSYFVHVGTKYLMPNRFYDGIMYHVPQLVETNTYKCDQVIKRGLGMALDVQDEAFVDKLYNSYFEIDDNLFNESCEQTLMEVLKEEEYFEECVKASIKMCRE